MSITLGIDDYAAKTLRRRGITSLKTVPPSARPVAVDGALGWYRSDPVSLRVFPSGLDGVRDSVATNIRRRVPQPEPWARRTAKADRPVGVILPNRQVFSSAPRPSGNEFSGIT